MLGKLFKHDMRQISKIMLPFMILVFGTTILGTAALKFAGEIYYYFEDNIIRNLLGSSLYLIFGFSVAALFAYMVLDIILAVSRYYKNFFSDEGYLTFTLPVKSSTLIFSKLWATFSWSIISAVVAIACILIYLTFGAAPVGKAINVVFWQWLKDVLVSLIRFFSDFNVSEAFIVVEAVALGLVSAIQGILALFLPITIGSIIAQKHKILASIGFYFLIHIAVSIVTTIVTTFILAVNLHDSADFFIHIYFISRIFVYATVMVTEFLITNYLIKKKLNLQ